MSSIATASLDYSNVALGFILIILSAWVFVTRDGFAQDIFRWYHSIPEGKVGPRWLRSQFRPTQRQSRLVAIALAGLGLILGIVALAAGLWK